MAKPHGITSRQYYIFALLISSAILLIGLIIGQIYKKIKADSIDNTVKMQDSLPSTDLNNTSAPTDTTNVGDIFAPGQ